MQKTLLLFWVWIIIFCSCTERKGQVITTSHDFDSVIIAADHLFDAGYKAEALNSVLEAHNRIKSLSLADEIHYFSYCNVIYDKRKDYDKSIEIADSMLWMLAKSEAGPNTAAWQTVAYNAKADALFAKGMYNDAYNYYYKAQKLAKDNKDSCSLRTYSYSLAMTLYKQQRFREAAGRFQEAYALSASCADEDFNIFYFKQEVLDNIGLCYSALNEYDSAMYFYKKTLAYLDERTGKYPYKQANVYESPKAVVYGNMAEVYLHTGKQDSAKSLYEHSIRINLQKGYTNNDAIADQVKLAGVYFTTGDMANTRHTLDAIEAELDTLPDKRVEMLWNKLNWQYSEHEHDSLRAYRHLRAYTLQNDEYRSLNKGMMGTDLDMRVKNIEKQYKIDLLTKDKQQTKLFLIILIVITLMAFTIVYLIWGNYKKSQKNIRQLQKLNDTIGKQKQQLELALEELKMKEKDKARILKSVAHDVMNPIGAIVSLTDILLHDEESCTDEQIELINLIREASSNSLNLSKDILEASKEMEGMGMQKEKTDINMLVAKSVELLNFRALAKKQQIIAKYPSKVIFAYVYKDRMRRVINNILANAIKFSHENATIEIKLEQQGNNVHIAIKDSGIGIPDANKPFIFDMFTDAKMRGTSGEITHGLGLSISLQIAKAHGGDIWFESEHGKGSTFYISFPMNNEHAG